jgi:hypothetical protein
MTTISIVPEPDSVSTRSFRAISGTCQSTGQTPGEALDAITEQLSDADGGTLFVIQQMKPDRFFTESQQRRLAELMSQWRVARDAGKVLDASTQQELECLIDEELKGSARRAEALLGRSQP